MLNLDAVLVYALVSQFPAHEAPNPQHPPHYDDKYSITRRPLHTQNLIFHTHTHHRSFSPAPYTDNQRHQPQRMPHPPTATNGHTLPQPTQNAFNTTPPQPRATQHIKYFDAQSKQKTNVALGYGRLKVYGSDVVTTKVGAPSLALFF